MGRTWLHRCSDSSDLATAVASPREVGSETASVFTTGLRATNLVARRPAGVQVRADDGTSDHADPEEHLAVGSRGEPLIVEAGSLTDVAHPAPDAFVTVRSTSAGAASGVAAPDRTALTPPEEAAAGLLRRVPDRR